MKQCSAVWCDAGPCHVEECTAVWCAAVQCKEMQCSVVKCGVLQHHTQDAGSGSDGSSGGKRKKDSRGSKYREPHNRCCT